MFGLSASENNENDDALSSGDGVTTNSTNSTLAYVVPAGVAGAGGSMPEVYPFGSEVTPAPSSTQTIYVKKSSPFKFFSDDAYTTEITDLKFVDGDTYIFDMSDISLVASSTNPLGIGLSTADDNKALGLTLTYNDTNKTYTYQHADVPGEDLYVYGIDTGADGLPDENDIVEAGMGNIVNAVIGQAQRPMEVTIIDDMAGGVIQTTDYEATSGQDIQVAKETLADGSIELTYISGGKVIGS